MKQSVVLIVSLVVGALAFLMSQKYLRDERARLWAGAQEVDVLVASRDLPVGTMLRREDVAVMPVFETAVGEQVFRPEDWARIEGKRLLFGLRRLDPLMWHAVDVPMPGVGGLAEMVRPELRAVSLAISGDAAVSGLVRPNDRVDILGTFDLPSRTLPGELETVTLTVLQDVTVLATGQTLATQIGMTTARGGAGGYSTVTFEVFPEEAELLVFAQHLKGRMTLTLRNPEDAEFLGRDKLRAIDFHRLEEKIPELNELRQRIIRRRTVGMDPVPE